MCGLCCSIFCVVVVNFFFVFNVSGLGSLFGQLSFGAALSFHLVSSLYIVFPLNVSILRIYRISRWFFFKKKKKINISQQSLLRLRHTKPFLFSLNFRHFHSNAHLLHRNWRRRKMVEIKWEKLWGKNSVGIKYIDI